MPCNNIIRITEIAILPFASKRGSFFFSFYKKGDHFKWVFAFRPSRPQTSTKKFPVFFRSLRTKPENSNVNPRRDLAHSLFSFQDQLPKTQSSFPLLNFCTARLPYVPGVSSQSSRSFPRPHVSATLASQVVFPAKTYLKYVRRRFVLFSNL